ncbi:hypothetical protein V492_03942 [Pseudogymnoascus sp. VKM F-4246]|nr:hypothetical protein V492_03942 [Pseudogymnoascus sp. VKM F-4246]
MSELAHAIKSAARREAWSDSRNPFGRTRSHDPRSYDVEEGVPHVRHADTEPVQRSPVEPGIISRTPSHAGSANAPVISAADKEAGITQTSEDSKAPGTGSTARPRSEEEKARSRFMSKFGKHSKEEKRPETTDSEDTKKHANKPFTFGGQMRSIFLGSWVNILLLAAPVGIALGASHQNFIAVFVVNFIAIIPLAALLSYATEEIALRVGETLGGLLNATFGNAVEVIVSVIALTKDEIIIVKTSLIGSILSNLLLVLGMCFLCGGLRREEQFFNTTVAQTAASLLVLAIASVIIPTVFDLWVSNTGVDKVAAISRGTSLILLFVYGMYLLFQLKTHSTMYNQESRKVPMKPRKKHLTPGNIQRGLAAAGGVGAAQGRTAADSLNEETNQDGLMNTMAYEETPDEPEEPQLHIYTAIGLLAASTAVVAVCAEYLVGSIDAITATGAISTEFVGLILLPIVGNAAEHATAVTVAIKDKMDLAIGVAVGSSMQIALLVLPFTVFLGWCMGKDDMNLSFDGFQVAVLFVTVLLVNYLISDGKSHWLEGIMLNCLYIIIAVTAWFYPKVEGLAE